MAKILTAERVSRDISDNYVFQRSQLAYHEAARRISGDVLEIGTGTGYGVEIVAPTPPAFSRSTKSNLRANGLRFRTWRCGKP